MKGGEAGIGMRGAVLLCVAVVIGSELLGLPLLRKVNTWGDSTKALVPVAGAPSLVVWNKPTIAEASQGNPVRGQFIARRCEKCHGVEGFSSKTTVPNLAGLDPRYIWKQLEDFHSGKRKSDVMQRIAAPLDGRDYADVAAYFSILPQNPDQQFDEVFPQPMKDAWADDTARRLLAVGDPDRGIPPCQACHGPVGQTPATPSLQSQNSDYLLRQLDDFGAGARTNDIDMPMRTIAGKLRENERQAAAEFYGAGLGRGTVGYEIPK